MDERLSEIYDPDDEFSIGSERESDIYDPDVSFSESESESTVGSRLSESTESNAMGPPRTIPPEEMILRRQYRELKATEEELRKYNREIIIENRQYKEDIQSLRENMSEKNAQIDVFKIIRERLEKEVSALNINNEVLKQRVADLTRKLPDQGGTRKNKRIKHVSKYSTSSKNHASRRYSSKR
jgi:SMC interacting uncharacterized protein involved in chromosome segregation